MDVTPATKKQLSLEAKKLAGAGMFDTILRWHRSVNQMSGQFVLLSRRPEEITLAHLDEWLSRTATMTKEMERLRKKLTSKKRKR